MPRARLQLDSPTTNALRSGSSFRHVQQIADASQTSSTSENNPVEFGHQRTESGCETSKASVQATKQPTHLRPQFPGEPLSFTA